MPTNKHKITEICITTAIWLLPVIFAGYLFFLQHKESAYIATKLVEIKDNIELKNPLDEIEIQGKSALVVDINTGDVLYSKNAEIPLPLASITKMMTALVTHAIAKDTEEVYISEGMPVIMEKDALYSGESFSLKKLIDYTLVTSSNVGAAALAQAVQQVSQGSSFTEKMNAMAKEIGMKETHFLNETGLDEDETRAGAYGSARDVATLMEYALINYPETFEATKEVSFYTYSSNGYPHRATNTNELAERLPNLIASKTGYTDIAGGNLAVIIDPALNRPVSIVVLGSTQKGRFDDVQKLADGVSKYFSLQD